MATIHLENGIISSSADYGLYRGTSKIVNIQDGEFRVLGDLIAENYIVSSSVTNIEYQSLSGSTIFGDSADDIHQFTGSINATGSLTVRGGSGGHPLTLQTDTGDKGITLLNSAGVEIFQVRQEAGDAGLTYLKDGNNVKVLFTARPDNHSYINVSGGRFGLGTASPDCKLDIVGDDFAGASLKIERTGDGENDDPALRLNRSGTVDANDRIGGIYFQDNDTSLALIRGEKIGANDGRLDFVVPNGSAVGNTTAPVMTIQNDKVGIGTINPGVALEVIGSISGSSTSTGSFGTAHIADTLSIGATNPTNRALKVHGTSGDISAEISNDATSNAFLRFSTDLDGTHRSGIIGMDYSDNVLRINHGGSFDGVNNGMAINSSGDIGIGQTPIGTHSAITQLTLGGNSFISFHTAAGTSKALRISQNSRLNSSGNIQYVSEDQASMYTQEHGTHLFRVVGSGTGNIDSNFTNALLIDNSGNSIFSGNVSGSATSTGSFGQLKILNTADAWASADDIIVGSTTKAATGISIVSTTSGEGNLAFADAVNGSAGQFAAYLRYDHNSTKMIFATEGVQRMYLDGSGKLGIGTASPDGELHVHAASAGTVTAPSEGNNFIIEDSATPGMSFLFPNTSKGSIFWGMPSDNDRMSIIGDPNNNRFDFATRGSSDFIQFRPDAAVLNLTLKGASGSEIAIFEGDVSGSATSTGSFGQLIVGGAVLFDGLTSPSLISGSSTSTGSFGALHTAGRVGIGTTSQKSNLTIQTTANSFDVDAATGTLQFGSVSGTPTPAITGRQTAGTHGLFLMAMGLDGTTTGDMIFNTRENNNSTFGTLTNAGFKFQHFSTDLVTILRNGKVGIGTASPSNALDVIGNIEYSTSLFSTGDNTFIRQNYRVVSKEESVTFSHGTANQKVDFYFTAVFWGTLKMTITGTYSNQNMSGLLEKTFYLGLNTGGTIYTNSARYSEVGGATAENFTISDLTWDSTNSRYKITVAHRNSNGNTIRVNFRAFAAAGNDTITAISHGDVYTSDTSVPDAPFVNLLDQGTAQGPQKIGIGTDSPVSTLEIQDGLTTTGAVLTLSTKEPSVVANDVLGRINFHSPLDTGGDSDLIGASIYALATATFSDTVNKTSLRFQTAASEDATGTTDALILNENNAAFFGQSTGTSAGAASIVHGSNSYLYIRGGASGLVIGDDTVNSRMQINNDGEIKFEIAGTARFEIDSNSRLSLSNNDAGGTAGKDSTTGNTFFGYGVGGTIDANTINNTFIGHGSGDGSKSDAQANTGLGTYSLNSLTSGDSNVAVGYLALEDLTSGTVNVAIGQQAGADLTTTGAIHNVIVGTQALYRATTGAGYNVAIGSYAMGGNFTTANVDSCVAIGYEALNGTLTTDATGTVAVGQRAAKAITSGAGNTAIGFKALTAENDGDHNTAVGYEALATQNASDGDGQNTAVGFRAGKAVTTASGSTFLGNLAGGTLTTGNDNIAIGNDAMNGAATTGDHNIAIGVSAGDALTSAYQNVLIGRNAGGSINTGDYNTAVGDNALKSATNGQYNVAIGLNTGDSTTTGDRLTLIGTAAGRGAIDNDGQGTVAIGYAAYNAGTSGIGNVAVGYET